MTINFTYDDFARPLVSIGDPYTVVIAGVATSVQLVTSYAYHQSPQPAAGTWEADQKTTAKDYLSGSTYTIIDPVTISNIDKDGRGLDQITSRRTTGAGLLSPGDTYAQPDWQTCYGNGGWHLI